MKQFRIEDIAPTSSAFLPAVLPGATIGHGGVYVFKPGEIAHPEPRHVHDVEEVFLFVQGRGILPIDGVEYPVETGDIIVVDAGEDHHLRSSEDDPLVSVWWVTTEAQK